MLDDLNVISQRDPSGALNVAANECSQLDYCPKMSCPDHDGRRIDNIVVAGMGGSALAALVLKTWLGPELRVPFEVVRDYNLPKYIGKNSLVILSSYSGNTEETLSCFKQAKSVSAQIAVIASGGELLEEARRIEAVHVTDGIQPRMALIFMLRALLMILDNFKLIDGEKLDEVAGLKDWMSSEVAKWLPSVPTSDNYAKQLAAQATGKIGMFYGGSLTAPLAYKWKISWNENAKNLAFWNQLPEFDHNEFIGWTSHPVEKPFAVFDLISNLEHPQILKRFEVSDRLLSGMRPKSTRIELRGESYIAQILWGCILADFVSIYLGIQNGVDPTPVPLIEKLKQELI